MGVCATHVAISPIVTIKHTKPTMSRKGFSLLALVLDIEGASVCYGLRAWQTIASQTPQPLAKHRVQRNKTRNYCIIAKKRFNTFEQLQAPQGGTKFLFCIIASSTSLLCYTLVCVCWPGNKNFAKFKDKQSEQARPWFLQSFLLSAPGQPSPSDFLL